MNKDLLTLALCGALLLGTRSAAAEFYPTVVSEGGSDTRHLFAGIGPTIGRLRWSPAAGWGVTWATHSNQSGTPTRSWADSIATLSWFDINVRPTGLVGGPQLETFALRFTPQGMRTARFRLSGDYGQGNNWTTYWGADVPPDAMTMGFVPRDGFVHYDNGIYTRHLFGHTYPYPPDASNSLREYFWQGSGWQWRDHGGPSSSGGTPDSIEMGSSSVEYINGETLVFVSAENVTLSTTPREVYLRRINAAHPDGIWESLGAPYQGSGQTRATRISAPVSLSYPVGGVTHIHVYAVIAREDAPFESQVDGCCVTPELWERQFDGVAWGAWQLHGSLPGAIARPFNDYTDAFEVNSAVTWLEGGQRQINVFANRIGIADVVTLECSGGSCSGPIAIATPSVNGQPPRLWAQTAFVHHDSFSYVSHIGYTPNGSVLEMYRDSRQPSSGWAWRELFVAPGTASDWDGDGLDNYDEETMAADDPTAFGCLDRYDSDSDGDGLSDADEVNLLGTSPCSADSDGDAMNDRYETQSGCLDALSADYFDDADADTLVNGAEMAMGTDPCNADSDDDGVDDGSDNCPGIDNASQSDQDGDGIGDACDGDRDGDGCPDFLDPTPTIPNSPTATCFLRLQDDIATDLELLDPRLDDPRLRDLVDGLLPRVPEGGIYCLSCPPFDLIRLNETTEESFAALKLEEYGFGSEVGAVYTAVLLPDLDGDGFGDFAVGLPLAMTSKGDKRGGVVLIVSGDSSRELARVEGRYADQGLGDGLGYRSDGYLQLQSAAGLAQWGHDSVLRLHDLGIADPHSGSGPGDPPGDK